jgi:hypothetical protein
MTEIVVIGLQPDDQAIQNLAEELLDGCISALQAFDTETLEAIAALREKINPGGWMQTMIWQYIEVWR